jgi:NTE family protein
VFEVLEQRQITPQIEAVAGTSAGAITATMMSLNYSADEFLKIMTTLDFKKFEDGWNLFGPIRLIRHFGWFKGNYFLNLMEFYIEQKTRDGRATFRDLVEKYQDLHFKRLLVFGTNLTQQAVQQFSYETTPDVAVADAVRISMSIPFFFEARYYAQNDSNDAYCDGGVLNNYPIDTFDERHTALILTRAIRCFIERLTRRRLDSISRIRTNPPHQSTACGALPSVSSTRFWTARIFC